MKKVKDAEGYDKLVPEVINVNVPQKISCTTCGGLPVALQVSASNKSASPFHAGNQSTRDGRPAKEAWKGDGKCKWCKGSGYVKKGMSPAKRLTFDDED